MALILEMNCCAKASPARKLLRYAGGDIVRPQQDQGRRFPASASDAAVKRPASEPAGKLADVPIGDPCVVGACLLALVGSTVALVRLVDKALDILCR